MAAPAPSVKVTPLTSVVAGSAMLGEHAKAAAEFGGRSILALPLVLDRQAVGVLLFRSTGGRLALDEESLALLRLLARLAKTNQILLFTCREDVVQAARAVNAPILDLREGKSD